VIDQSGVSRLAIKQAHIWKVRDLEFHHRDRLLVARTLGEGLTVVSRDRVSYGAATRW
jgi:PIN domain nuclease of toxin-antitoxin system